MEAQAVNESGTKPGKRNKLESRAHAAIRRARLTHRLPAWADVQEIKQLFEKAAERSARSGVRFEVVHIVPARGKNVCGLFCPDNLRVVSISDKRMRAKLNLE